MRWIQIAVIAFVFVSLGMLPTVLPFLTKPASRGYTWAEGFIDDYVGYVSYVKEGMYGRNSFAIRSLPKTGQQPTSGHLLYIAIGKIGALLHVTAPVAYHIARAVIGIILIFFIYQIFLKSLGSSPIALLTTVLALLATGLSSFVFQGGQLIYTRFGQFGFSENSAIRAVSRPHYDFGACLFLLVSILLLRKKTEAPVVATIAISSFILAIDHPSFGLILFVTIFLMAISDVAGRRTIKSIMSRCFGLAGLAIGLLLSNWSIHQYPFTTMLSFEKYVGLERLSFQQIFGDIIAFGPSLWFGFAGLIIHCYLTRGTHAWTRFFLFWIVVQLLFFFVLYPYIGAQRVRFIQSLYFIPLAYGTVRFFQLTLSNILGRGWIIPIFLLIALFLPAYIHGFSDKLYENTDYKNYPYFVFPNIATMEAYQYLDTHTPIESTVIATYEAANNILLYSHNFVIGNKEGWDPAQGRKMEERVDAFFSGQLTLSQAISLLESNSIEYVYYGYQERGSNDAMSYKFLTPVFKNSDVVIYRVSVLQ